MTTYFSTTPELVAVADKLKVHALAGNANALELLIELHRLDENRMASKTVFEAMSRSIEKVFGKKEVAT
jgi:hypothetical protein